MQGPFLVLECLSANEQRLDKDVSSSLDIHVLNWIRYFLALQTSWILGILDLLVWVLFVLQLCP